METPINLNICQDCKINPATYGDGLTWSRCSQCQYKHSQSESVEKPEKVLVPPPPVTQEPVSDPAESFEHVIVPGLTSIIVPVYMNNYTLFHYTGNCIGAVREHTPEDLYELVVIDNGSPVKPPSEQSYYAQRVIQNERNLGVTKAWNQGIRMSVGEYIVLLNNDVQVFDHWLEDMKSAIDNNGYDLVMAHPMYSKTEPFARALESAKIRGQKVGTFSQFKDFSCVMFKRLLVEEIGLFNEDFFNYCSDSDFFKRLEATGKRWACAEFVPTSHISDATGFSISDTPRIMDKDKETYRLLWESNPRPQSSQINVSPEIIERAKFLQEQAKQPEWAPPIVESKPKKDGLLVRSAATGDAIFLKGKDNKFHHVTSPEVLHALGFDFGQEVIIDSVDSLGDDITMNNYQLYE